MHKIYYTVYTYSIYQTKIDIIHETLSTVCVTLSYPFHICSCKIVKLEYYTYMFKFIVKMRIYDNFIN